MTSHELISLLAITNEDIRAEAVKQPMLFIQAARYRVAKMRQRARSGAELDATRARIAMVIRNKKNKVGKKLTEGNLKEIVETNTKVKELRVLSDRAYEQEEFSKLLLEAYRQRNSSIKIIAEMQSFEGNREATHEVFEQQRAVMVKQAQKVGSKRRE